MSAILRRPSTSSASLLISELSKPLENSGVRHRLHQKIAQGPDQRVNPIGRCARATAVETQPGPGAGIAHKRAHLVFEDREGAEMTHLAPLVQRGDRLRPHD